MSVFGDAVAGPVVVTETSEETNAVVSARAVLFPVFVSAVVSFTVAKLLTICPPVTSGLRCTVSVNAAEEPFDSDAMLQATVPDPPTAGSAQPKAGPEFWVKETKVVKPGTTSVSETFCEVSGPL